MFSKIHNHAPLPFQGQKRNFVKRFAAELAAIDKQQGINLVVDLFGGSGLLSHVAKRVLPHARVIYNDFDNYSQRLSNIEQTNAVLSDIRNLLAKYKTLERISELDKEAVINRLKKDQDTGFVDYISLSGAILFSGNYATSYEEIAKATLYNRVPKQNYPSCAAGYLGGLEVVKGDYRQLYEEHRHAPRVLFLLDPPYLTTDTKTYDSMQYWRLVDFLNILNVLQEHSFVFFTSYKSSLIELCDWMQQHRGVRSPFDGATFYDQKSSTTKGQYYTDNMIVRISDN